MGHARMVNRISGGRGGWKRFAMNRACVGKVFSGQSVAIFTPEGVIGFIPFGDYVQISFKRYERQ